MESNTLFFKVSTGGSLLQGRQGSAQTYRYVGGIAHVWKTEKGNFRNVWAFKEAVRRLVGGDPDIKIFFEVVNDEDLRHLRPLQTHEDASVLVKIGTAVPFTKVFVVPTVEVANQLDSVRQPESEVLIGYFTDDSVHN